jgi:hypothetical protein
VCSSKKLINIIKAIIRVSVALDFHSVLSAVRCQDLNRVEILAIGPDFCGLLAFRCSDILFINLHHVSLI